MFKFKLGGAASTLLSYWWAIRPAIKYTMPQTLSWTTIRARAHRPLCLATGGRAFVAGIFIHVGNHYFQALASTLQFVAQVCDRLWLVPATDREFLWLRSTFGSEHTSDCSCGMWQPLSRVGNFAEYGNFAGG